MLKNLKEKIEEKVRELSPADIAKKLLIFLVLSWVCGYILLCLIMNFGNLFSGEPMDFMPELLIKPYTILAGIGIIAAFFLMTSGGLHFGKSIFSDSKRSDVGDSVLENSRFMTDKERDENFPHFEYDKIKEQKADGVPGEASGQLPCPRNFQFRT